MQSSVAAVLTLACAAGAQQPVQWRVEDGGNGHWYALRAREGRTWTQAATACRSEGGHLATMTGPAERDFMVSVMAGNTCAIGGLQSPAGPQDEPASRWSWITGEPMSWANWASWEPSNTDAYGAASEEVMGCFANGVWVDLADHLQWTGHYVVEWDLDCNGDGIVDHGQIRSGELADANANGIADPCEVQFAIAVDGTADVAYGDPLRVQGIGTGFGDANLGQSSYCNGSELDAAYARIDWVGGYLFLVLAGNLQSNYNNLVVFVDSKLGAGQN
ncbi:MAG: lectin-like protein, partial [Phycisphaerales bacterium]